MDKLDKFTQAYVECALWSSTDDNGEPFDANYTVEDIAPETLEKMIEDCEDFQESNAALLADINPEQAGHDFWLTRNHHGAGFWDRGLGELGQKLTDQTHAYGDCYLYLGDDGKIHGE